MTIGTSLLGQVSRIKKIGISRRSSLESSNPRGKKRRSRGRDLEELIDKISKHRKLESRNLSTFFSRSEEVSKVKFSRSKESIVKNIESFSFKFAFLKFFSRILLQRRYRGAKKRSHQQENFSTFLRGKKRKKQERDFIVSK